MNYEYCAVCYEILNNTNKIQLICLHSFCKKCILKYIKINIDSFDIQLNNKTFLHDYIYELYNILKCPLCRTNINILQLKDSEYLLENITNKTELYKKEFMYYTRSFEHNNKYINNILLHSETLQLNITDIYDMMCNSFELSNIKNYTAYISVPELTKENKNTTKDIVITLFTNYYYSKHCLTNNSEFVNFLNSFNLQLLTDITCYNILEEILTVIKKDYTNYNLIILLESFIFKYIKNEELFSYIFMKDFVVLLKFYHEYNFELPQQCNNSIKNILTVIYKKEESFLTMAPSEQCEIIEILINMNPEFINYTFLKGLLTKMQLPEHILNKLLLLFLEKNEYTLYYEIFPKIELLTCFNEILKLENNNELIQYLNISQILIKSDYNNNKQIFNNIFIKQSEYSIEYINYITLIMEFLSYFEENNSSLDFLDWNGILYLQENNYKFWGLSKDLYNTIIHIYGKKFFEKYISTKEMIIHNIISNHFELAINHILLNKNISFDKYYHKYTNNNISLFKKQKIIHLICLSNYTMEYLTFMKGFKEQSEMLYNNSINSKNYEGNYPLHILLKNKNNFNNVYLFVKLFNSIIDYSSKDILGISLLDYLNKIYI